MGITRGFIYLLCLGLVFLGFSLVLNNSFTVFLIYDLICVILLIVDYFISDMDNKIEIKRIGDEKLSIYADEEISFEVYNKSDYTLNIEVKDEVPDLHFKVVKKNTRSKISPHQKNILKYNVIPMKRGAFLFKNLHVRYKGRLGLCYRFFKVNLEKEYKVYPNLENLRKYRMSICNNRSFKQGQRNLKILGRGTSFESLREYMPGDEFRKINWKATARENKPIVNQYEPEKNQHVYMLIDTGRTMSYTIRGYRKLDMVVNTALVLSDIVNQNGDKSGLLLFNTKVQNMVIPGKGAGHRNKILESLYHIEHTNETSNFEDAFYYLKKKERHRSIIFLFTDFDNIEEAEDMLRALPIISKTNTVVLVFMRNEKLEELSSTKINNAEELFNKGVALEFLKERKKIIRLLNTKNILCIECPAEKLEYTVINKYIEVKNRTYL